MDKVRNVGAWQFEIKQIFCRRTPAHGEPYSASAVITITDGLPHVELLMSCGDTPLSRADYRDIKQYITGLGFSMASYGRYKRGRFDTVEKD